ncbi:MAG: hypothetical protein AAB638_02185, partial [Patescibacteria group bacterium]
IRLSSIRTFMTHNFELVNANGYALLPAMKNSSEEKDRDYHTSRLHYIRNIADRAYRAYIAIIKQFENYSPKIEPKPKVKSLPIPVSSADRFQNLKPSDISFDKNQDAIVVRGVACPISGTIRIAFCVSIFSKAIGQKFTTTELEELVDSQSDPAKQSDQRIYDAYRAINKKIQKVFGIAQLVLHKNEKYWLQI